MVYFCLKYDHMFIKQLSTGCFSEEAYYIESDGVAAIVDPLRDVDSYLQRARERNPQKPIVLLVKRGDSTRFIAVQPEE